MRESKPLMGPISSVRTKNAMKFVAAQNPNAVIFNCKTYDGVISCEQLITSLRPVFSKIGTGVDAEIGIDVD
jgi:hypothetical protein